MKEFSEYLSHFLKNKDDDRFFKDFISKYKELSLSSIQFSKNIKGLNEKVSKLEKGSYAYKAFQIIGEIDEMIIKYLNRNKYHKWF